MINLSNKKKIGYVVGQTTSKDVWLVSEDRPFKLDEYIKISDKLHEDPIAEVLESFAYPVAEAELFAKETGISSSLKHLGIIDDTAQPRIIYLAKAKLLKEFLTPINSLSVVILPNFEDIESLIFKTKPEEGFSLGVIRGTDDLQQILPTTYQNVVQLFDGVDSLLKQNGVPFILDYRKMREYPHVGLFGGTGSGKTFGLRAMTEELMKKQIPNLLFDPHHEMSFRNELAGGTSATYFSSQHEIFYVGKSVGIRFEDMTKDEFLGLFPFVGDLSPQMRGAIESIYEEKDSVVTFRNRLQRLIRIYEIKEDDKKRGPYQEPEEEITGDDELFYRRVKSKIPGLSTLNAISWRFESLVQTGIFESNVDGVERALLELKTAVIRGGQRLLNMIASYLIRKLYGKRRAYCDFGREQRSGHNARDLAVDAFPPFFITTDEAHIFAPEGQYSTPTKAILREIAQEARKYGVFLNLATQRPASLDTTIVSQLNTKFIFRTGKHLDIEMVRQETTLNEAQIGRLPDLTSGNAFVSSALLRKPFYVQFRATDTASPHSDNPFDELSSFNAVPELLKNFILNEIPFNDFKMVDLLKGARGAVNRNLTQKEFQSACDKLASQRIIKKEEAPMGLGFEYKKVEENKK